MSPALQPGDVVGIGIHTGNALRGYEVGRRVARGRRHGRVRRHPHDALPGRSARARQRARRRARRRRPGLADRCSPTSRPARFCRRYEGGKVAGDQFVPARWDLLPPGRYMWASVQTVRGCPKHCSFCSVWRTDGQEPRMRAVDAVMNEVVTLRRKGFRFIALADDNFYPVALKDLEQAARPRGQDASARAAGTARRALRADEAAGEASEGLGVLHADHHGSRRRPRVPRRDARRQYQGRAGRRRSRDAGRPEGDLQGFQPGGRCSSPNVCAPSRTTACTCSGRSFSDCRPTGRDTFDATAALAEQAGITFAQFVMLTPFPGHARLRQVGEEPRRRAAVGRRHPADASLADSGREAAEVLHASSDDDARRSARADAGRMGSVL